MHRLSGMIAAGIALTGVLVAATPPFSVISEAQRLSVDDLPEEAGVGSYGWHLQVSGDTLAFTGTNAPRSWIETTVHLHVWDGTKWTFQQMIDDSDASEYGEFGRSIALSGDTLVVSAPEEPKGELSGAGALFVYQRTNGVWSLQAKLHANDAKAGDRLGGQVAIDGDTIVTTAYGGLGDPGENAGSAYVFHRQDGVWSQQGELPTNRYSRPGDDRPGRLALHGDVFMVGVPTERVATNDAAGRVYLFRRENDTWQADGTLAASNGDDYDFFGSCIAFNDDTLMIGAVEGGVTLGEGKVYAYRREGDHWAIHQLIKTGFELLDPLRRFGSVLRLQGDTLLVNGQGAGPSGRHPETGSFFLFRREEGGKWVKRDYLLPEVSAESSGYHAAMDLHGENEMLILGKEDIPGTDPYDPTLNDRGVVIHLRVAEGTGPEFRMIAGGSWDEDSTLKPDEWNTLLPLEKTTTGLFGLWDTDESGNLDIHELLAGSASPALPPIYGRWLDRLEIMGELDENSDFELSRDEISRMFAPGQGKSADAFVKRAKVPMPMIAHHWLRLKTLPNLAKYEEAKIERARRTQRVETLDADSNDFISRLEFAALFPAATSVAKINAAWRVATGTPKKAIAPEELAVRDFIEATLPAKWLAE